MKKLYLFTAITLFISMLLMPLAAVRGQRAGEDGETPPVTRPPSGKDPGVKVLLKSTGEVVNVSTRDYLWGVVAGEMLASFEEEALKAQAVAAHTFALWRQRQYKMDNPPELAGADISDDPNVDQRFLSKETAKSQWGEVYYIKYAQKIEDAVASVQDKLLLYNGDIILSVYHDTSSGRTESSQIMWGEMYPYLTPVESIGDLLSKQYLSTKDYAPDEFIEQTKALGLTLSGDPSAFVQKAPERSPSGTVTAYTLGGQVFSGEKIRAAFGLRSANFDLEYAEGKLTFTVRGFGHGVGMSQSGAQYMALQGSKFDEILSWYYPGTVLGYGTPQGAGN
ncbi:MAG: stage II sporulation protein D [Oscillospiraceae bacterium]|jgi:stage II sporulation protein D|nr:stage II sporulation protein D [Oscillospiraceae bacterium]